MTNHNKLIRDKIPDIIQKSGKKFTTRTLTNEEFLTELKKKIIEEAKEVEQAKNKTELIEELADIQELINATLNQIGGTYEELEQVRKTKKEKNGGFDKAIYLIEVEDEP
ncbi:MAG: nucleoside triphosphate pyrophosphohydrolase [Streptococcaceae bacterium]|jgi:predicted house-cleaning noncanonical NTP pyrophosphatase (MazG superfamily)|nr:nucleoside triphosphate pyrophosphohydrolase [Streptococcaceae bacterium]